MYPFIQLRSSRRKLAGVRVHRLMGLVMPRRDNGSVSDWAVMHPNELSLVVPPQKMGLNRRRIERLSV